MEHIENIPLAERMRPLTIDKYIGQEHLIGEGKILTKLLLNKSCPSIIFWGPPGTGKTTIANIIANELNKEFISLSAINSGVKEMREVFEKANFNTLLFVDEIHRFNKLQQDSLLKAVETGKITLVGATTENPSFEINNALLSRCKVFVLKEFSSTDLLSIANNAIKNDLILKSYSIKIVEQNALLLLSSGDARKLLGIIELIVMCSIDNTIDIDDDLVINTLNQNIHSYDKSGDMHYDIVSALIKSLRGSDPNASLYYLARMIEGGEDPKFIARRLLIFASEDISLANSNALLLANTTFDVVSKIGYPECRLVLAQLVVFLATCSKSNSTYIAYNLAQEEVRNNVNLSVPLHLRNAPSKLMKELGYAKDYKYPHQFEGNFVQENYLPKEIENKIFYKPQNNQRESEIFNFLKNKWPKKYI